MSNSYWQKQNNSIRNIVRGSALLVSILLSILLVALGILEIAQTSLLFLVLFMVTEIIFAYILKNLYANSIVRVLRLNYEEIEWHFRMLFKKKNIRFHRREEENAYRYDFPGHKLSMTIEPHWIEKDLNAKPMTKVTLHELTAENEPFAQMVAESINEMANEQANSKAKQA